MPYQVQGEQHIRDWLAEEAEPACREAMLDWIPRLAEDPAGVATVRRDRPGVPVYVAAVPGTYAFVDYSVVEQYKTVLIIHVANATLEEFLRRLGPGED